MITEQINHRINIYLLYLYNTLIISSAEWRQRVDILAHMPALHDSIIVQPLVKVVFNICMFCKEFPLTLSIISIFHRYCLPLTLVMFITA